MTSDEAFEKAAAVLEAAEKRASVECDPSGAEALVKVAEGWRVLGVDLRHDGPTALRNEAQSWARARLAGYGLEDFQ